MQRQPCGARFNWGRQDVRTWGPCARAAGGGGASLSRPQRAQIISAQWAQRVVIKAARLGCGDRGRLWCPPWLDQQYAPCAHESWEATCAHLAGPPSSLPQHPGQNAGACLSIPPERRHGCAHHSRTLWGPLQACRRLRPPRSCLVQLLDPTRGSAPTGLWEAWAEPMCTWVGPMGTTTGSSGCRTFVALCSS